MPLFGPPNIEKLKGKRDVKGLIKALENQQDVRLRLAAVEALDEVGDVRAISALIATLRVISHVDEHFSIYRSEHIKLRTAAVRALGRIGIGDENVAVALIDANKDEYFEVAGSVTAEAFIQIGTPAIPPLIDLMKSFYSGQYEDYHLREHLHQLAITALGRIRPPAIEALITLLNENPDAAEALVLIGTPAIEPLIDELGSENDHVRYAVVEALEKIGWQPTLDRNGAVYFITKREYEKCKEIGKPAVDLLIAELKIFALPGYAQRIMDTLVAIGDPRAVEPIISLLNNKDKGIRISAARSLIMIYTSGELDTAVRKRILENRSIIEGPHSDNSTHAYVDPPSKCADLGPDHDDQHADRGIGVAFPL